MKKLDQGFELQTLNLLISTDNERPRFSFLLSSKGPDTGGKSLEHRLRTQMWIQIYLGSNPGLIFISCVTLEKLHNLHKTQLSHL